MELRVLQYFLAVAREQSISAAAESLHLSQPTLSTQLKALEQELGKQLLIRGTKGSRKVLLTEEGMLLRKRAEEILELVRMTESEISLLLLGYGEELPIDGINAAMTRVTNRHNGETRWRFWGWPTGGAQCILLRWDVF